MKFTLLLLLLVAPCAFNIYATAITLSDILDVVQIGKDIVITVGKTWNIIDDHYDVSEIPLPIVSKRERLLLNRMNLINSKIAQVNQEVQDIGARTITVLLKTLPEKISIDMKLNDLKDYMTRIDVYYHRMVSYTNKSIQRQRGLFERVTLEDFAQTVVSHDPSSVQSLMERIHVYFNSQNQGLVDTDIVLSLRQFGDVSNFLCTMKGSTAVSIEYKYHITDFNLYIWHLSKY